MNALRIDGPGGVKDPKGLDPKGPGKAGRASSAKGSMGAAGAAAASASSSRGDGVSISPQARLMAILSRLPDVREDRVEMLRQAIADGTFDDITDIDEAIRGMLEDI